MNFQISALSRSRFEQFFTMPEQALAEHGVMRIMVTKEPGFPCRVSLEDAQVDEHVLLINHEHLDVNTPFRSRNAIYVRVGAVEAKPAVNEVPEMFRLRELALRAWTTDGMLAAAELVNGAQVEDVIFKLLSIPETAFVQIHFAKPGCYAARVDRA